MLYSSLLKKPSFEPSLFEQSLTTERDPCTRASHFRPPVYSSTIAVHQRFVHLRIRSWDTARSRCCLIYRHDPHSSHFRHPVYSSTIAVHQRSIRSQPINSHAAVSSVAFPARSPSQFWNLFSTASDFNEGHTSISRTSKPTVRHKGSSTRTPTTPKTERTFSTPRAWVAFLFNSQISSIIAIDLRRAAHERQPQAKSAIH
jgi:hypothetical protein